MTAQDPLAQLRDIHPPEPIGLWPLAPGWWLLAALGGILLAGLGLYLWQRYRQNAYRRAALHELHNLWQAYQANGDEVAYVTAVNQLLRRTARVAFPNARADINRLQGESWLGWLDHTLANPHHPEAFRRGPGQHLVSLPYRPQSGHSPTDLTQLQQLAQHWLQRHQGSDHYQQAAQSGGGRYAGV